jgi:hypothetical protein
MGIYEGDLVNNKMTGKVTKTYVDGRVKNENWKYRVLIK